MGNERIARADVAEPVASDTTVRRSTLHVGSALDPLERDADRVADDVMRALASAPPMGGGRSGDGDRDRGRVQRGSARPAARVDHPASRRVRRSAIGPAGDALDAATSDTIERRRGGGAPLEGRVRRRMEHGFGADLGHVRLHTGTEASALNESMQAAAFTVGSDVFLHASSPSIATPAGERLLAHEIAHTFQQGGAPRRQVRRKMMSTAAFNESTDEGFFTQSSKAQKSIRVLLDAYHATFPWESQFAMTALQATAAVDRLEEIRRVAKMWIQDHEVDVNGTVTRDPKRLKRRAGMDQLIAACETEMRVMRDLIQLKNTGGVANADQDLSTVNIAHESEAYSKVKEKYDGDALSAFRRLGFLIDGAVPVVGDKSAIAMEVTIPIPPGFITLEFGTEAKRDSAAPKKDAQGNPIAVAGDKSRVEAALTVGVSGGASVGSVAKLSAGIGCYLSAKARTGADVAELMSYALFRRCRESVLVPREVENAMWGNGRSGDFGWVKAEQWSKGVEERIFGNDDEAEVSSGAYGKLAANIEVSKDLASLGFEVKGTKGTKITKESIVGAKGAVGAQNKTDAGGAVSDGGGVRGTTQASLGVKNMGLETSAKFAFGILSGGIKAEFGWSRSGVVAGQPTYVFDTFKIGADLTGQMPMNKMAGDAIAALIPNLVGSINKVIRGSMQAAQAETTARTAGAITEDVGSYAAAIAELASVPKETWQPFAANPATAGLEAGSTASIELSGSFDFKQSELVVELRLGKSSALTNAVKAGGDVVQVFKLDITKSSRLLKLTHTSGGWAAS